MCSKPDQFPLWCRLFGTRNEIDCALRDDFDTPTALQRILDLVQKTNAYLARKSNNHSQNESSDQESDHERSGALSVGQSAVHVHLVRSVAHFVDRMLCLFGLEMTRPKEVSCVSRVCFVQLMHLCRMDWPLL